MIKNIFKQEQQKTGILSQSKSYESSCLLVWLIFALLNYSCKNIKYFYTNSNKTLPVVEELCKYYASA